MSYNHYFCDECGEHWTSDTEFGVADTCPRCTTANDKPFAQTEQKELVGSDSAYGKWSLLSQKRWERLQKESEKGK